MRFNSLMPIPTTPVERSDFEPQREVFERLLGAIVLGRYAPHERLDDGELAEQLGVAPHLVRQAFSRLATLWLVDIAPRKYTEVAPVNLRRVRECLSVYDVLSKYLLARGVELLTEEDKATLSAPLAALKDDASGTAWVEAGGFTSLDNILAQRVGNASIQRMLEWVQPYLQRASYFFLAEANRSSTWREQAAVVEAAVHADAEAALAAWPHFVDAAISSYLSEGDLGPSFETDHIAKRQSLREFVAAAILEAIQDGTLRPGEALPEADLAAWLKVSRTPVRDALTTLGALGVVDLVSNQSARVAQMDRKLVDDTMEASAVLYSLGIREALANDKAGLIEGLTEAIDKVAADDADLVAGGSLFTYTIVFSSGNQTLIELHQRTVARLRWFAYSDPAIAAVITPEILGAVRDAVADDDVELAENLVRNLYSTRASWAGPTSQVSSKV